MSDIKPWQIILIVLAVCMLAFTGFKMTGGGPVDGPSGYMTVDVMTGQLYLLKKGKAKGMLLPALNPETKKRTLYPVDESESSGSWVLDEGYAQYIPDQLRDESTVLGKGFNIQILNNDPIVHVIRK